MKIIHERETQRQKIKKKQQKKANKTEKNKVEGGGGGRSNSERVRAKRFCCASISSLYNTPCNRFYNNYVINICPRQLL